MTRNLTINNLTKSDIIITCQNDYQEIIEANSRVKIEIPDVEKIRIFKKKKTSAKFCIGQFFIKETLRNVWIFSLILMLNFDTIITVPKAIKNIDINEEYYHYSVFTLFSLLTVNEKFLKSSYDFHSLKDKRMLIIQSCTYLLPILFISLVLCLGTFGGIFLNLDFSFEAIILYLLCIGFNFIFIGLIKSANRFINFSKYSIEEIKNIKPVEIIKTHKNYVKYKESD